MNQITRFCCRLTDFIFPPDRSVMMEGMEELDTARSSNKSKDEDASDDPTSAGVIFQATIRTPQSGSHKLKPGEFCRTFRCLPACSLNLGPASVARAYVYLELPFFRSPCSYFVAWLIPAFRFGLCSMTAWCPRTSLIACATETCARDPRYTDFCSSLVNLPTSCFFPV